MKPQIFKLEAWKTSIKKSLRKLSEIHYKKNSEITVIIKENQSIPDEEGMPSLAQMIDIQENQEEGDQENSSDQSLQIQISNTDILPNIVIKPKTKRKMSALKLRKHQIQDQNSPDDDKNSPRKSFKKSINKIKAKNEEQEQEEASKDQIAKKSQKMTPPSIDQGTPLSKIIKMQRVEQVQLQNQNSMDEITISDDDSAADSIFVVENLLNDSLSLINQNRIFQLEEFLNDFKTKYTNINDRVQIKWRLLMAYCKENRKEYERASILYYQVLQLVRQSPKALAIDRADINHRLGICYMEIRKWNSGIMVFVEALTQLKEKKRVIKYAECMNNLGTLYLYSDHIDQAEKCFLVSYEIKMKNYPPSSPKLLSCLLNLYECNIATHNYEQAHEMLKLGENIVKSIPNNQMLWGGLLRRKGKLAFLKGELQNAEECYNKAASMLSQKFPYCLDYGELMNNYGMLMLDQGDPQEARIYFQRALVILNFYFSKDSYYVEAIRRNIDLTNKASEYLMNL